MHFNMHAPYKLASFRGIMQGNIYEGEDWAEQGALQALQALGAFSKLTHTKLPCEKKGCVRAAPWQMMLAGSPITTPFSAGAFGETIFDAHSQPRKSIGITPRQTACLEGDGRHATIKRPPEDARPKTRASNNSL
jgi:hypothetical protein